MFKDFQQADDWLLNNKISDKIFVRDFVCQSDDCKNPIRKHSRLVKTLCRILFRPDDLVIESFGYSNYLLVLQVVPADVSAPVQEVSEMLLQKNKSSVMFLHAAHLVEALFRLPYRP